MKQQYTLNDIFPIMQEIIENGGEVQFISSGRSMLPMLRDRKDTIVLTKATLPLKKLDIPLYQRADGSFVLHRVVGHNKNGYIMCGDNQFVKEYGIKDSQIKAILKAYIKDGVRTECTDENYLAYAKKRISTRRLRDIKRRLRPLYSKFIKNNNKTK